MNKDSWNSTCDFFCGDVVLVYSVQFILFATNALERAPSFGGLRRIKHNNKIAP